MWLNEGFTVFIERKVSEGIHGTNFAKTEALLGNVSLFEDMDAYIASKQTTYASLYPVMNGASPDDSFSEVPYEKGYQFLTYLEGLLTSKDDFQTLIKEYIEAYSLKSVSYTDWKSFFLSWIDKKYDTATVKKITDAIDWDTWITADGSNKYMATLDFHTDE